MHGEDPLPNPSSLEDDELRTRHEDVLRLQEQELEQGSRELALEMAYHRQDIFDEARDRGIDL